MRRADQLTTPSQHIFMTEITQSDGIKTQVMSSQPLSDHSVRVNRAWTEKRSEGKQDVSEQYTHAGALFLLMTLCSHGNIFYRNMVCDVWKEILGFTSFELKRHEQLESVGNYAVAIRRPPSLFQAIKMDPSFVSFVVDAVMRGQEDMVMNVLHANPDYLLQYAPVKNSVGVEYTVTPLQAAIMANDVQMIGKMHEHFVRLPDGYAEMQAQILQIYKESLQSYLDKQKAKMTWDTRYEGNVALEYNNITMIFKAHQSAQINNTFNFQPYVDAICKAPQAELDEVMALIKAKTEEETADVIASTGVAATQTDVARDKTFDQLTLLEKLNRFREELVNHMRRETIFNSNHLQRVLRHSEVIWDEVAGNRAEDLNYKKQSVISSQLVGWTQRCAPEPVKQDIRQGICFLTIKHDPRTRPSCFNCRCPNGLTHMNYIPDVSLGNSSVVDGLGYKFSVTSLVAKQWEEFEPKQWMGRAGPSARFDGSRAIVEIYVFEKQKAFESLLCCERKRPRSINEM